MTLIATDKIGKHRFKLLKRHTTEDMWGARMIFDAPRGKRGRFLIGARDLKIEIIKPRGPADREDDRNIEVLNFVKGRLEVENRFANRDEADS